MSKMKEKMIEYIDLAIESKENSDELLEANWLETTDEYVINRGELIIVDGLTEQESWYILDELQGACNE